MDKPNVVLVTHSGIIANIIICVMNIMNITKGDQTKGKNCTITVIKKEKKKESKNANSAKYTLMSFPNTEHL
jgi:broad specificity phosphatase PhoE